MSGKRRSEWLTCTKCGKEAYGEAGTGLCDPCRAGVGKALAEEPMFVYTGDTGKMPVPVLGPGRVIPVTDDWNLICYGPVSGSAPGTWLPCHPKCPSCPWKMIGKP